MTAQCPTSASATNIRGRSTELAGGMKPTVPIISGGMNALRLPGLFDNLGHANFINTAGGGAYGHIDGPRRVRAPSQAYECWQAGPTRSNGPPPIAISLGPSSPSLLTPTGCTPAAGPAGRLMRSCIPTLTRYLLGVGRAPDQQDHAAHPQRSGRGHEDHRGRGQPGTTDRPGPHQGASAHGQRVQARSTAAPPPTSCCPKWPICPSWRRFRWLGGHTSTRFQPSGRFLLLVDAMHGLGNLDDNLSVGATFSLLQLEPPDQRSLRATSASPARSRSALVWSCSAHVPCWS